MLQPRLGGDGHAVNHNLALAVWRDCHLTVQISEGSVFIGNSKKKRVCLSDSENYDFSDQFRSFLLLCTLDPRHEAFVGFTVGGDGELGAEGH